MTLIILWHSSMCPLLVGRMKMACSCPHILFSGCLLLLNVLHTSRLMPLHCVLCNHIMASLALHTMLSVCTVDGAMAKLESFANIF